MCLWSRPLTRRFVDPQMLPYLQEAWKEIVDEEELTQLHDDLLEADEMRLKEHGLLGAQLEAKRHNILRWYDRLRATARAWILRRLIGASSALLDSILDALGVGGLLREFLDLLNDSIEEGAEGS